MRYGSDNILNGGSELLGRVYQKHRLRNFRRAAAAQATEKSFITTIAAPCRGNFDVHGWCNDGHCWGFILKQTANNPALNLTHAPNSYILDRYRSEVKPWRLVTSKRHKRMNWRIDAEYCTAWNTPNLDKCWKVRCD